MRLVDASVTTSDNRGSLQILELHRMSICYQDQGYRVGDLQAFRQHCDEEPDQKFYARGWRHFRNAPVSNYSNSLTAAWRIAACKNRSDLGAEKIHEHNPEKN